MTAGKAHKKPIPEEMKDIAEVVKRECKTYDDLRYKIEVVRTRPYSRLVAIVNYGGINPRVLKDVCEERPEVERELVMYVKKLGVCNEKVRIYRGGSPILPGDWVALEREYAAECGEPVYELEVPTEDVIWAGTYEKEWFYVPKKLRGYFKDIAEFWLSVMDSAELKAEEYSLLEAWRESMAASLFMLSLAFAVMMFARSAERG